MANNNDYVVSSIFPGLWNVLQAARRAVPAVDYALGAAGVAVAGAIVTYAIGRERASVIIFGGMLVAMVLLFVFARLVISRSVAATNAGIVLLWAVTIFFCVFLFFTATAVAFGWPPLWGPVLGLGQSVVGTGTKPASDPLATCAPVLSNERIIQKCNLSVAQARATARDTLREITTLVALVLTSKDTRLFPNMEDYLKETNEVRRAQLWLMVQEATTGKTGLLTTVDKASTALLDLDARLRTDGTELARDPAGVREILLRIQTKELKPREEMGRVIAATQSPNNQLVAQWYKNLKELVQALSTDLNSLSAKLSEPV
jgi:hypothetical protein